MATSSAADGPIYIGGLARSGKTYVRLMLMAHPDVFISKRTNLWTHHDGRYGDLSLPANLNRCLAALMQSKHIRALEPDTLRLRRELSAGAMSYERLFALLHSHQMERLGKRRWGDQTEGIEAHAPRLLAADPGGADLWDACDLTGPVALVLGAEHDGLSPALRAACDGTVAIPMHGAGASLNVSTAAAVLLDEAARQRRARNRTGAR